jgi:hypothetical protein
MPDFILEPDDDAGLFEPSTRQLHLTSGLVVDFVNPLQVVTTYAHVEHMV